MWSGSSRAPCRPGVCALACTRRADGAWGGSRGTYRLSAALKPEKPAWHSWGSRWELSVQVVMWSELPEWTMVSVLPLAQVCTAPDLPYCKGPETRTGPWEPGLGNIVHLLNGILLGRKKKERNLTFCDGMEDPEKSMLSEMNQSEKDQYRILLICGI